MIAFDLDPYQESLNIDLDSEGIDKLITYLQLIKNKQKTYIFNQNNGLNTDANPDKDYITIQWIKVIKM